MCLNKAAIDGSQSYIWAMVYRKAEEEINDDSFCYSLLLISYSYAVLYKVLASVIFCDLLTATCANGFPRFVFLVKVNIS